jgi:hypothetical protein
MPVTVKLPTILRKFAGDEARVTVEGATLEEVLKDLVGPRDQHRALESADQRSRDAPSGSLETQGPRRAAVFEHVGQPDLVVVEEPHDPLAHRLGQGRVVGGEHPAQAHPIVSENRRVQLGVRAELLRRVDPASVDGHEGVREPHRVPFDQCFPELRLAGVVVVERRLRDVELFGDVRVTESVEAAFLHQTLGHIEDLGRGIHLGRSHRSRSFPLRDG